MKRDNIILIGMPGAGKSTVGVLLAKYTNREFVDTDVIIQSEEGLSLSQIIEKEGYQRFIKIEASYVMELSCENSVIAPGGSIVYSEAGMLHLSDLGKILYLFTPYQSIRQRVENMGERGVVSQPGQTLEDVYRERHPLYSKWADITVSTDGLDQQQVLGTVLGAWPKRSERPLQS